MPIVAAAVVVASFIAKIVAVIVTVVKFLATIIASIVAVVKSVIGVIVGFIGSVVGVVKFIFGWVVSAIMSIKTVIFTLFTRMKAFFVTLFQKLNLGAVWKAVLTIKDYVWGILKSVIGRIWRFLSPYLDGLKMFLNKILTPVRVITGYVKSILNWVRGSILGKIFGYLKEIAGFIQAVRIGVIIYELLREQKWAKAAWMIVKYVDSKIASEIEGVVRELQAEVYSIRNEILAIIDSAQRDIRYVDAKASYLESTFRKLYEAFGVPVFGDVAREISRLRRGILDTVERELYRADNFIMERFRIFTDPFFSVLKMFYDVDRILREERWLAEAFAYNPYQDGFLKYRPKRVILIPIPRIILERFPWQR